MSKEDTNSIKYILEEMDPAEKLEFERYMEINPDLRIEVESIRRMNGKLKDLPSLVPPEQLTNSILSVAAEQTGKKQGSKSGYFLSAAVVILGLTTGALILQNSAGNGTSTGTNNASISTYGTSDFNVAESRDQNLQPWVDRQDVLRLTGFESSSNLLQLKEIGSSYDKLRPVGSYPTLQPFNRSVQLTGSNR